MRGAGSRSPARALPWTCCRPISRGSESNEVTRRLWTVRPMGERDAAAVVELLAQIAREGSYIATEWPFDQAARTRTIRDALLLRRSVGWIAVDGRELIGELTV